MLEVVCAMLLLSATDTIAIVDPQSGLTVQAGLLYPIDDVLAAWETVDYVDGTDDVFVATWASVRM